MKEEYLRRKCYYSNKTDIFDTLIENIGKLLNHNIHVDIRLNVDAKNVNYCIKVAEYLKKKYSSYLNLNVYPAFLSSEKYNTANNFDFLVSDIRKLISVYQKGASALNPELVNNKMKMLIKVRKREKDEIFNTIQRYENQLKKLQKEEKIYERPNVGVIAKKFLKRKMEN